MNIFKKPKLLVATAIIAGVAAVGIGAVHAASNSGGQNSFITNLVSAIASKFNLNPSDVQSVVQSVESTQKTQMQANAQQSFATHLAQLVSNGSLTQTQADAITAERTTLQAGQAAFMASLKSDTADQRKAAMQQQMTDIQNWATQNNIPQQYIGLVSGFGFGGSGMGFGRGHGMGGPRGTWQKPGSSPSPSPSSN